MEQSQRLRMVIFDMHKPVIAQVHGYCLAGGTDIALLCDIIIAAEDATIGFPPARAMGALPEQHVAVQLRPAVGEATLPHGRHDHRRRSGPDRARAESRPLEQLTAEVEGLVDRMAMIDTELLSANKRIVNLGLELMGARTMQRLATENDARAHLAPSVREFGRIAGRTGTQGCARAGATASSAMAAPASTGPKRGMKTAA